MFEIKTKQMGTRTDFILFKDNIEIYRSISDLNCIRELEEVHGQSVHDCILGKGVRTKKR